MLVRVVPGLFPPDLVVQIKALACELPAKHGLPLSRWSTDDLVRQVCQSSLMASISGSTLWRWLHQDRHSTLVSPQLDLSTPYGFRR